MAAFTIREARREDCKEMLRLIRESATFKKLSSSLTLTEKDLERDAFDTEQPFFQSYVVQDPNGSSNLIAYTMYFYTYGTWSGRRINVEDLFVTEVYRGKGVGDLLFKQLVQKAEETNSTDMAWSVQNSIRATKFFQARGARDMTEAEEWHVFQ